MSGTVQMLQTSHKCERKTGAVQMGTIIRTSVEEERMLRKCKQQMRERGGEEKVE